MKKKKIVILIFTIAYLIYILLFPKKGMSSISTSIGLFFKIMITRLILTLIVFIVISNIINKIIKREDIGGDLVE